MLMPSSPSMLISILVAVSMCLPDITAATSGCRLHRIVHRIQRPNCITKRLLSLACKGDCQSYSRYIHDTDEIDHYCSCCQATDKAVRRIRMTCYNDMSRDYETRIVQLMLPTGCMCRPCSNAEEAPVNEVTPGIEELSPWKAAPKLAPSSGQNSLDNIETTDE